MNIIFRRQSPTVAAGRRQCLVVAAGYAPVDGAVRNLTPAICRSTVLSGGHRWPCISRWRCPAFEAGGQTSAFRVCRSLPVDGRVRRSPPAIRQSRAESGGLLRWTAESIGRGRPSGGRQQMCANFSVITGESPVIIGNGSVLKITGILKPYKSARR